jgi:4-phospho-D-threonate 3-dehydrogenase / 4-phospho-D-erythronate 3-dehydrogenase
LEADQQAVSSPRPLLAITLGDVAGIGPEIVAKALSRPEIYERCRPLAVGDAEALASALRTTDRNEAQINVLSDPSRGVYKLGTVDVFQPVAQVVGVTPGRLSADAGRAAVAYVQAAATLARSGSVDAIVTAPINKAAMYAAGFSFPGHTEILADFFGVRRYSLVLTCRDLFVFHVTTHESLRSALDHITRPAVLAMVELAAEFARARGDGTEPIAVAGLNPHAGEGGVFGHEEISEIAPAIEDAVARGIPAVGPVPADALWHAAVNGTYRYLVALYHDQGHAPFKAVFGEAGVNITVGLPVVRTSVDHGTAFDIAGTGVAREDSLVHAITLAVELAPGWEFVGAASRARRPDHGAF